MPTTITKGSIKRDIKESTQVTQKELKQQESKVKQVQKALNAKTQVLYTKTIMDAYIQEFANNYGANFDYNTLTSALNFHFKEDKQGNLLPSYTFNYDRVIFKSDAKKECRDFNENSYTDFISNEDSIQGIELNLKNFDNVTEYEDYQEIKKNENTVEINKDGQFIPISDNQDRYGEFNRINKIAGYTPVNVSGDNAAKIADSNWNKIHKN